MALQAKGLMLSALIKKIYKGKTSLADLFSEKIDLVDFTIPQKERGRGDSLADWIAGIHHSWLQPYLADVPKALLPHIATALSPAQREALKLEASNLAPPVVLFFQKWLFGKAAGPDILPYSLLPDSPLDKLLFMNKARVIHLIDLLGIHDLAIDFKKVIDKNVQEKMQAILSPLQKQYLTYCMAEMLIPLQQTKPASFWLDHKEPRALIHSAGLWRLTRLIAGEEKSWQWYFTHYLDRGRGQQMQKWIEQDKEIALQGKARDIVLGQVLRLIEALQ